MYSTRDGSTLPPPPFVPPPRVCVLTLLRPYIPLHTTSFQFGVFRTLSLIRRFCWWIGNLTSPHTGGSAAASIARRARLRAKHFAGLPHLCIYLTAPASSSAWTASAPYPNRFKVRPTSSFVLTTSAPRRLVRHYRGAVHRLRHG